MKPGNPLQSPSLQRLLLPPLMMGAVILVGIELARDVYPLVRSYLQPPAREEAAPVLPPDPLGHFSADLARRLVSHEPLLYPVVFEQNLLAEPQELCRMLDDLGMETSDWQQAPFRVSQWQCASEAVALSTPSIDYAKATLFVLARGSRKGEVDSLRFKLNVPDPKQMEHGLESLDLLLDLLKTRFSVYPPEGFSEAVANFRRFRGEHRGVSYQVLPEDPNLINDEAAARRVNVLMQFPEPPLILQVGHFR